MASALVYSGVSGTMTFSATGGTSSKTGTSSSIILNPGALDHFAVSIATPQVAGTAFTGSCSITAQDEWNNTITTFDASAGNVTVTASSGGTITGLGSGNNAVLDQAGDFTSGVAAVSGALTYSGVSGTITLTATGGTPSSTGTSSSVVVNPGALDHFAVSFASPQTPTVAFNGPCTITAQDAWNNTVTTFDASADNVTVAASSGGTITGLGSGSNAVLNQVGDFVSGVADLSGSLIYTGTEGVLTFTTTGGTSSKTGTSSSVTMRLLTIITVAGDGTDGYSGDAGAATSAQLQFPYGGAVDWAGNLYIADAYNNRIRKVAAGTGIITTVAGDGTRGYSGDSGAATSAKLDYPYDVAVDRIGNLYIADTYNSRIRKVAVDTGIISTVAGTGSPGYSGDGAAATSAMINYPYGVVVDEGGNLYIADTYNSSIRKVDASTGTITTVAGDGTPGYSGDSGPATSAKLNNPSRVALDPANNEYILIADSGNHCIRKVAINTETISSAGTITTVAGVGTLGSSGDLGAATSAKLTYPYGVVADAVGNFYIADTFNHKIRKVEASSGVIYTVAGTGVAGDSGDSGAAPSAQLSDPSGVAIDEAGSLFVFDRGNSRVRKMEHIELLSVTTTSLAFATVGVEYGQEVFARGGSGTGYAWTVSAGSLPTGLSLASGTPDALISGTPASAGTSNFTLQVTDGDGYEATQDFSLQVAGPSLNISTVVGTGSPGYSGDGAAATAAQLYFPQDMALDRRGNLYIAEELNHRVRKVDIQSGLITTVAGTGVAGDSGDGGLATAAQIDTPSGVAVDGVGNLYIADTGNHRVRKVAVYTGVITPVAGDGTSAYGGDGAVATSAQMKEPVRVAVDMLGNIYIADRTDHRIRRVLSCTGIIATLAGTGVAGFSGDSGAATSAQLNSPSGLIVGNSGSLYIVDRDNNRVRKVDLASGVITTAVGDGTVSIVRSPMSAGVDAAGNLYIADTDNNFVRIHEVGDGATTVTSVAGNGLSGYNGDGIAATSARLNYARGVALSALGYIYIVDTDNHRVRRVGP